MRRLSSSNNLQYWQCIIPGVLAKCIASYPSGESLYYYGKLVSYGFRFELETTDKQFRFARYQEATMQYLAQTQSESDFLSMDKFYLWMCFALINRIDKIGPLTYATLFQQFIRFIGQSKVPTNDSEMWKIINAYIKHITNDKS